MCNMADVKSLSYPKLKGSENYIPWASCTQVLIEGNGTWDIVPGERECPEALTPEAASASAGGMPDPKVVTTATAVWSQEIKDWKKDDANCRKVIMLQCSDHILQDVRLVKTAKKMWIQLKDTYSQKGFANVYENFTNLSNLKYRECKDVEDYVQSFRRYTTELAQLDCEVNKKQQVVLFLSGLNDDFEAWVSRKRTEARVNLPEIDELVTEVTDEARIKEQKDKESVAAIAKKHVIRSSNRNRHTDGRERCVHDRIEERCFECNPGIAPSWYKGSDVQEKNRERALKKSQQGNGGNGEKDTKQSSVVFTLNPKALAAVSDLKNEWVIDTGASDHMACQEHFFIKTTIKPYRGQIRQADGTLDAVSIGDCRMPWIRDDGTTHHVLMRDVLYVPRLFTNLLSVRKMKSRGVTFNTGTNEVVDKAGAVIGTATETQQHWLLNWEPGQLNPDEQGGVPGAAALPVAAQNSELEKWHKRLGHLSYRNILRTSKCVIGMDVDARDAEADLLDGLCDICEMAKSKRQVSREPQRRAAKPLELIHLDVVGWIKPLSENGNRWVFAFTDDATRCRWVRFGKTKDQAYDALVELIAFLEKQFELPVKRLRTDQGRELGMGKLKTYCAAKGIALQETAPYAPEQNGTAEKGNDLISTKARALIGGRKDASNDVGRSSSGCSIPLKSICCVSPRQPCDTSREAERPHLRNQSQER